MPEINTTAFSSDTYVAIPHYFLCVSIFEISKYVSGVDLPAKHEATLCGRGVLVAWIPFMSVEVACYS